MADYSRLTELAEYGRLLRSMGDATHVHNRFGQWVDEVARELERIAPNSGFGIGWMAQGESPLVVGGGYYDDPISWATFDNIVQHRLNWLAQIPARVSLVRVVAPERIQSQALASGRREIQFDTKARAFVDPSRIEELKKLASPDYDFTKLVRLCEELNVCFAAECYLAVAMLTRSLLDHVPPIFSGKSFKEAANNYSGGSSFKASMQNLENSSRKIADQHLHAQIRKSEVLPNAKQADFSNDLDVLLAEIVRLHKRNPSSP